MKKGFWSKKTNEFTGGDCIKYIIAVYAIFMAFYGVVMVIIAKADEIGEFFKSLWTKIYAKFTRNYAWVETDEEDLELY